MQALIDAAQQWRRELRDGMVDGDRFYPELCLSLDGAPYIRVPPLIMCDSSCGEALESRIELSSGVIHVTLVGRANVAVQSWHRYEGEITPAKIEEARLAAYNGYRARLASVRRRARG